MSFGVETFAAIASSEETVEGLVFCCSWPNSKRETFAEAVGLEID